MIDIHCPTWKAVIKFVEGERRDAVDCLIADKDSERQRGSLAVLAKILQLADEPDERVIVDDYSS